MSLLVNHNSIPDRLVLFNVHNGSEVLLASVCLSDKACDKLICGNGAFNWHLLRITAFFYINNTGIYYFHMSQLQIVYFYFKNKFKKQKKHFLRLSVTMSLSQLHLLPVLDNFLSQAKDFEVCQLIHVKVTLIKYGQSQLITCELIINPAKYLQPNHRSTCLTNL